MNFKFSIYAFMFSALTFSQIAVAQVVLKGTASPKPKKEVAAKLPVDTIAYSKAPFLLAAESTIPNDYHGHDIKAIYQALQEKMKGKGEFETTTEYKERIANTSTTPFLGTLKADSIFAVCVEADSQYDADAGTSTVTFPLSKPPILISEFDKRADEGVMVFSRKLVEESTYEATNGYGAKATILKQDWENYGVFLLGWKKINLKPYFEMKYIESEPEGRFLIPMPVDVAKEAKGNLRVLASFTINEPFITATDDFGGKTTIQNPFDAHFKYYLLRGVVKDVFVYNKITGKVLHVGNK
jgi:hypothetical protein